MGRREERQRNCGSQQKDILQRPIAEAYRFANPEEREDDEDKLNEPRQIALRRSDCG